MGTIKKIILGLAICLIFVAPIFAAAATTVTCDKFSVAGEYCLLTGPMEGFFSDGKVKIKAEGLDTYLNTLYKVGVAAATGLALLYITIGGVRYASTDAVTGKDEGRGMISNAFLGLMIVLGSYIVLNAINPDLLNNDIVLDDVPGWGSISADTTGLTIVNNGVITFTDANGKTVTQAVPAGFITTGTRNDTLAGSLLTQAQNSVGKNYCESTDKNVGCVTSFNGVFSKATGVPLTSGASTVEAYDALVKSNQFAILTGDMNQTLPGDVIVSVTKGDNHGHIGIVETAGGTSIISNSSTSGTMQRYWSLSKWNDYYTTGKGLSTYIFRPATK